MMEPKFIELHDADPIAVNVALIEYFANETVSMVNSEHRVYESYDEIKQLIKESGILIHRADPRLDTTTPLTMADLKEMIGEPVWNSNTGKWTLVRNYIEALEPDGVDVAFLLDAADISAGMTAGDLVKFPLYRMRRTLD